MRKLIVLGASGIHWGFAIALLAGGLIAAPLAALLVRIAPAHLLGVAVGGLIVLTNARTLLGSFEVPNSAIPVYVAILLVARNGSLSGGPTRQAQARSRPRESGAGSGQRLTS